MKTATRTFANHPHLSAPRRDVPCTIRVVAMTSAGRIGYTIKVSSVDAFLATPKYHGVTIESVTVIKREV